MASFQIKCIVVFTVIFVTSCFDDTKYTRIRGGSSSIQESKRVGAFVVQYSFEEEFQRAIDSIFDNRLIEVWLEYLWKYVQLNRDSVQVLTEYQGISFRFTKPVDSDIVLFDYQLIIDKVCNSGTDGGLLRVRLDSLDRLSKSIRVVEMMNGSCKEVIDTIGVYNLIPVPIDVHLQ